MGKPMLISSLLSGFVNFVPFGVSGLIFLVLEAVI
jgi:hypothetical protein